MRKLFLFAALVIGISSLATAQQDPQYTMFMFNKQALNPAYAGSHLATDLVLLGRSQWVGVPGAPQTSTISMNGYVKALHGGLGGYIIGDKLGPLRTLGAKAAYSFHLDFGQAGVAPSLNIGIGGGIYQKVLNGVWKYDPDPGPDPVLASAQSVLKGDLDAGIYFHVPLKGITSDVEPRDKFYIGGSVTHLLEPSIDDLALPDANNVEAVLARGIQAFAGFTFRLDQNIYLQPSANFRMAGPIMQYDINANLYVSPMVFGVSHRWKDSFSGIIGFNATTNLFMAYSYDYTISKLAGFTTGSHELILSYTFPTKNKRPGIEGNTRWQPETGK